MIKNKEQQGIEPKSEKRSFLKINLLSSSEGCIFLVGVTIALIYALWLGTKFIFNPVDANVLAAMTATSIIFGRAAAMTVGYTMGLGHSTVIPVSMIIETMLVLIFYPLFVFSWNHLLVIKGLKSIFDRIHKAAEFHEVKVRKYGTIGLFAFVWFPFWMTGPVVGCVIGFLLALPVWLNISVVLAGTYVAILGWAFFLRTIHEQIASYSSHAAIILMVIIIGIIIIGHLMYRSQQENKNKH